jgi:hypothetical protein
VGGGTAGSNPEGVAETDPAAPTEAKDAGVSGLNEQRIDSRNERVERRASEFVSIGFT